MTRVTSLIIEKYDIKKLGSLKRIILDDDSTKTIIANKVDISKSKYKDDKIRMTILEGVTSVTVSIRDPNYFKTKPKGE